jgi:membrane protein implicated in regulation of membrane protease activity
VITDLLFRVLAELGPWIWILAGLLLCSIEVVWPRGHALAVGLGALLTGTAIVTVQFTRLAMEDVLGQLVFFVLVSAAIVVFLRQRGAAR